MLDKSKSNFWAACGKCSWFATYQTRADAADGQRQHDAAHDLPWVLTPSDRKFLKINRIAVVEDCE